LCYIGISPRDRAGLSARDSDVLPLLVGIQIKLLLVAVIGQLVIHPVKQGGTDQGFAVLEDLAHPDDENIVFGDLLAVGLVQMGVGIVSDGLSAERNKLLFRHGNNSPLFNFSGQAILEGVAPFSGTPCPVISCL